jgi:hypothetical protein
MRTKPLGKFVKADEQMKIELRQEVRSEVENLIRQNRLKSQWI